LQRPRRRRRRQRREEKVAWLGGLGCAEDVWPVAQEASAKVTVAGGKGSKKKEEDNRRGYREEREIDGGSWWSVGGCVGFLWWS
jgi:hypothetical protein